MPVGSGQVQGRYLTLRSVGLGTPGLTGISSVRTLCAQTSWTQLAEGRSFSLQ